MRPDLVEKASQLIGSKPRLTTIVSQRVRELDEGCSPLVALEGHGPLAQADIALLEIIEGKIMEDGAGDNLGTGLEEDQRAYKIRPASRPRRGHSGSWKPDPASPLSDAVWRPKEQLQELADRMQMARRVASSNSREEFLAQLSRHGRNSGPGSTR